MNTDELKKLLKGSTAVLILDNGEPSFVVLGYDTYKGLLSDQEKEVKINHPNAGNGQIQQIQPIDDTLSKSANKAGVSMRGSVSKDFQHRLSEKESELLEKINKQILSLKDEIDREEKSAGNVDID